MRARAWLGLAAAGLTVIVDGAYVLLIVQQGGTARVMRAKLTFQDPQLPAGVLREILEPARETMSLLA